MDKALYEAKEEKTKLMFRQMNAAMQSMKTLMDVAMISMLELLTKEPSRQQFESQVFGKAKIPCILCIFA